MYHILQGDGTVKIGDVLMNDLLLNGGELIEAASRFQQKRVKAPAKVFFQVAEEPKKLGWKGF